MSASRRPTGDRRRRAATLARVLLNWVCVFTVMWLVERSFTAFSVFAAVLVIGIEQHALGLWMHEGGHGLIARSRRTNDILVGLLLSGPLLVPLFAFRRRHFAHHAHLGTADDTKQVIFTRIDGGQLLRFVLRTCLGLQFLAIARGYLSAHAPGPKWSWRMESGWFHDAASIAAAQGALLLPAERHPFTRTLAPTPLERLLFCRAGFQYHAAHHHAPDVPWFDLPRVRWNEEPHEPRRGYLETLRLLARGPRAPLGEHGG